MSAFRAAEAEAEAAEAEAAEAEGAAGAESGDEQEDPVTRYEPEAMEAMRCAHGGAIERLSIVCCGRGAGGRRGGKGREKGARRWYQW